jgi:DNA-binding CsgD family transcriptional regulator
MSGGAQGEREYWPAELGWHARCAASRVGVLDEKNDHAPGSALLDTMPEAKVSKNGGDLADQVQQAQRRGLGVIVWAYELGPQALRIVEEAHVPPPAVESQRTTPPRTAPASAWREMLRTAAVAADRRKRRRRPRASDAWEALVAGRGSLVDQFEAGGRRFLIVRRDRGAGSTLAPREAAVIALRARGAALKLIAHELGVSVATVDRSLRNALKKLGVRTAAELMQLFGSDRSDGGRWQRGVAGG